MLLIILKCSQFFDLAHSVHVTFLLLDMVILGDLPTWFLCWCIIAETYVLCSLLRGGSGRT